MKFINPFN
jgi:group I intron endonuclease